MTLRQSHVIQLTISCPIDRALSFLADPLNFPKWAAVVGPMTQIGPQEWLAQTEFGERIIRFCVANEFGIFDHAVFRDGDEPIMLPLRVTPNEDGCDLTFVFFRRQGLSDEQFASAIEWVTNDFLTLRALLEFEPQRSS